MNAVGWQVLIMLAVAALAFWICEPSHEDEEEGK